MLHIIWGILKLTGIIIGILLLILLAVICSLLLVPVRYQVRAVKEEKILEAEANISWMCHLISMAVSVGNGRKLSVTVRLFGRRLPFFQDRGRQKEKKKRTSSSKKRRGRLSGKRVENSGTVQNQKMGKPEEAGPLPEIKQAAASGEPDTEKQTTAPEVPDNTKQTTAPEAPDNTKQTTAPEAPDNTKQTTAPEAPDNTKQTTAPEAPDNTKQAPASGEPDNTDQSENEKASGTRLGDVIMGSGRDMDIDQEENDTQSGHADETDGEANTEAGESSDIAGKFRNIWFKVQSICAKIKQIPGQIRKFFEAASSIPKKIKSLCEKTGRLLQKPSMIFELMEEYEIRDVLRMMKCELVYLFRHCGPRRIQGYLNFGTGDPALTGQLTGLIYLLLPARAEKFSVRPDFYEARLETRFICTGHIRGIHFVCTAFRILKDQKVRRIIRRFIKKGE